MDASPALTETLIYMYRVAAAAGAAGDAAALRRALRELGVNVDNLDAQDARRRAARSN